MKDYPARKLLPIQCTSFSTSSENVKHRKFIITTAPLIIQKRNQIATLQSAAFELENRGREILSKGCFAHTVKLSAGDEN